MFAAGVPLNLAGVDFQARYQGDPTGGGQLGGHQTEERAMLRADF